MKRTLTLIAALGLSTMLAPFVLGDTGSYPGNPAPSYYVSAPVLQVDPIYVSRTIQNPIRQCNEVSYRSEAYYDDRDYDHYRREENHFLPGLFGGIVGGLIGNQFGGGNGKKAMTVIGALAGSSIAREAARESTRTRRQPVRTCRTTYETEVVQDINAYDVTYEYGGQQFSKRMTEHPGDSVRVRVELTPEFDRP